MQGRGSSNTHIYLPIGKMNQYVIPRHYENILEILLKNNQRKENSAKKIQSATRKYRNHQQNKKVRLIQEYIKGFLNRQRVNPLKKSKRMSKHYKSWERNVKNQSKFTISTGAAENIVFLIKKLKNTNNQRKNNTKINTHLKLNRIISQLEKQIKVWSYMLVLDVLHNVTMFDPRIPLTNKEIAVIAEVVDKQIKKEYKNMINIPNNFIKKTERLNEPSSYINLVANLAFTYGKSGNILANRNSRNKKIKTFQKKIFDVVVKSIRDYWKIRVSNVNTSIQLYAKKKKLTNFSNITNNQINSFVGNAEKNINTYFGNSGVRINRNWVEIY